MKTIYSLLIVFSFALLLSNIMIAQVTENIQVTPMTRNSYNKVEFGVKVSPSFSSYKTKTYNGQTVEGESVNNYGFGGLIKYNFSNYISAEMEVLYNSFSKKYTDGYLKRQLNIKYVDIPLLFSLSTNKFLPVSFNVVCGPQIGFNAGSTYKTSGTTERDTLNAVLSMKQIDFGFAYGAGLVLSMSAMQAMHVGIGFRGVYGFTNINNAAAISTNGSYSILADGTIKTYSGYLTFIFSF